MGRFPTEVNAQTFHLLAVLVWRDAFQVAGELGLQGIKTFFLLNLPVGFLPVLGHAVGTNASRTVFELRFR